MAAGTRSDRGEQAPGRFDSIRINWGLLSLPALVVLGIAFAVPIIALAVDSLYTFAGPARVTPPLTLNNYIAFFTDSHYLGVLLDTFVLGLIVVSVCTVLAYPVAYFLARTRSRWRGTLIFLVVAPLLISTVIRNLGWLPLLGTNGFINTALLALHLIKEPAPLVNNFTGVVIGTTHALLPFMILMLMNVIQRINPEIEEAAVNLGATPWKNFRQVILPLSYPGLIGGYLIVFTITISSYTTPAMLGGNRVAFMSTFVAQQFRFVLNYAFGATCGVILMVFSILLTVMAARQSEKKS